MKHEYALPRFQLLIYPRYFSKTPSFPSTKPCLSLINLHRTYFFNKIKYKSEVRGLQDFPFFFFGITSLGLKRKDSWKKEENKLPANPTGPTPTGFQISSYIRLSSQK